MKFPLFPIRRTLSPPPTLNTPPPFAFFSAPHLFLCPFGPVSTIDTILLLTLCVVFAAKLQDRRWRRPAARLWAASAGHGDGGLPSRHQEAVSETETGHGSLRCTEIMFLQSWWRESDYGLMFITRSRNELLKTFCLFGNYKPRQLKRNGKL